MMASTKVPQLNSKRDGLKVPYNLHNMVVRNLYGAKEIVWNIYY